MATEQTPALDLSTLVERPCVRIDGELYGLRHVDEFSYLDLELARQRMDRANKLSGLDGVEAAKELEALLDESCRVVLDAPDEVHAKLKTHHRSAIIRTFFTLQLETPAPAGGSAPAAEGSQPTIGESGSPDSPASIQAATPVAG